MKNACAVSVTAHLTKNTKILRYVTIFHYLLIVVVIKYSLLKSKMTETGSGSDPKAAVISDQYLLEITPTM